MPYPYSFIKLTGQERVRIINESTRLAIEGKMRAWRRFQSIYLSDQGYTYSQICQSLEVSYATVEGLVSIYRKKRLDGLLKRNELLGEKSFYPL